jgi:hypothetical protein
MVQINCEQGVNAEGLLAELTEAAYRVALRHGLKGPFVDVELDLWRELRRVLGDRGEART